MGAAQPRLFSDDEVGPKPYVPNPRHVRNRLESLLNEMRKAQRWPWEGAVLELYRDNVLPKLCGELPDKEEAARWRLEIEAEIRRLDLAA